MGEKRLDLEVTQDASDVASIERLCEQFETAAKGGELLSIEDLLTGWEEPERSKLLSELLLIELDYASQRGETLGPSMFDSRFPEHRQVVKDVFDQWFDSRRSDTTESEEDTVDMRSQFGQLRLHAEGGLGMVFRADDRCLSREVALKFIRSNLAADNLSRERFQLEAEITSRLEHPGIVPVYGLGGTSDGELFYAMRFIQGQTLEEFIDNFHEAAANEPKEDHSRRFRELLTRFVAVCKTIAYAHNRGIVHRDIKPANIMLGRYGETLVIDWGLAMPIGRRGVFKDSGEMTLQPSSGNSSGDSWGGTPAYMSPEQAAGTLELTPASDIYSLGVTLYKVLVGTIPFTGSLHDLRSKVIRGEFKQPSSANRHVSKSVEAICLKAMALSPADRYETAMDLAQDVENYLADVQVSAYNEPVSLRLARWGRRHRTLSQSVLVALLLLTASGILATAVFSNLRTQAVVLQQSEHELRKNSLSVSARFAARTIADKIDIRVRVLESLAHASELHQFMKPLDADPQNDALREPLQNWFTEQRGKHEHIQDRSWFICAANGSQVARSPRLQEDGTPFGSLRKNYEYRDYFHGRLSDFETGPPIEQPHVSIAMESTNGGDLIIVFSAPIKPSADAPPLGVIGMSIALGQFADLDIPLPAGEKVILADTRRYFMKLTDSDDKGPSGEGLLLHHPDLAGIESANDLPHLDKQTVEYMQDMSTEQFRNNNLLPATYRDPLGDMEAAAPIAAFAPVILTARPTEARIHQTNWFVIIQQQ